MSGFEKWVRSRWDFFDSQPHELERSETGQAYLNQLTQAKSEAFQAAEAEAKVVIDALVMALRAKCNWADDGYDAHSKDAIKLAAEWKKQGGQS